MPLVLKAKNDGTLYEIPDNEREEALATGKFTEHYRMKAKNDGKEYLIPAEEMGEALKTNKFELSEVYNQRKQIEANPTQATHAPISKTDSALTGLVGSATLGFDDEIYGGLAGLKDAATTDKSFGDAYTENRDKVRDMKSRAEKENPLSYLGGSLAGGAVLPIGAGKAASTMVGAIGKGAAVGALTGGIQGLGDNEKSDEVLGDIGGGIVKGGVTGGIAGGVGRLSNVFTKSGRADLSNEWNAFKAGSDSVNPNFLPGVDRSIKWWNGIKETLNSADAQQEVSKFLGNSKLNTVSRMVEDGSIPPSHEKAYRNALDKLSDEEYILMKLQEGDPEVSNWIAKQSGGNVAEKQKFLAMSPDDRQSLRSLDLNKDAKELTPITKAAKDSLWADTTGKIESATANARENFSGSVENLTNAHSAAHNDLQSMGKLVGSAPAKHVDSSFEIIMQGKGGRSDWNLQPDVPFDSAPSATKFNRVQKAREIIDEGIDWDKINAKVRKPTTGEKILMDYRSSLDEILKSAPGKSTADDAYRTATELDDMLFGKTELKGSVDPYKIKELLNNTSSANRFRDGLVRLKEWSNSADPEAKAAADKFLNRFQGLFDKKKSSDALNQLSREGGPSALQIQRLDRSLKGDTSVTKQAVKQTADFLLDNESTTSFLQDSIGKAYKDMSLPEKTAFTRVYLKLKQQGGIGSPEAIKHNFGVELSKIK